MPGDGIALVILDVIDVEELGVGLIGANLQVRTIGAPQPINAPARGLVVCVIEAGVGQDRAVVERQLDERGGAGERIGPRRGQRHVPACKADGREGRVALEEVGEGRRGASHPHVRAIELDEPIVEAVCVIEPVGEVRRVDEMAGLRVALDVLDGARVENGPPGHRSAVVGDDDGARGGAAGIVDAKGERARELVVAPPGSVIGREAATDVVGLPDVGLDAERAADAGERGGIPALKVSACTEPVVLGALVLPGVHESRAVVELTGDALGDRPARTRETDLVIKRELIERVEAVEHVAVGGGHLPAGEVDALELLEVAEHVADVRGRAHVEAGAVVVQDVGEDLLTSIGRIKAVVGERVAVGAGDEVVPAVVFHVGTAVVADAVRSGEPHAHVTGLGAARGPNMLHGARLEDVEPGSVAPPQGKVAGVHIVGTAAVAPADRRAGVASGREVRKRLVRAGSSTIPERLRLAVVGPERIVVRAERATDAGRPDQRYGTSGVLVVGKVSTVAHVGQVRRSVKPGVGPFSRAPRAIVLPACDHTSGKAGAVKNDVGTDTDGRGARAGKHVG